MAEETLKSLSELGAAFPNIEVQSDGGSGGSVEKKLSPRALIAIRFGERDFNTKDIARELNRADVKELSTMSEEEATALGIDPVTLRAFTNAYYNLKTQLRRVQILERGNKEIFSGTKEKLETAFLEHITATKKMNEASAKSRPQEVVGPDSRAPLTHKTPNMEAQVIKIARRSEEILMTKKSPELDDALSEIDRGSEHLSDDEIKVLLKAESGKFLLARALSARMNAPGLTRGTLAELEKQNEVVGYTVAKNNLTEIKKIIRTFSIEQSADNLIEQIHRYIDVSKQFKDSIATYLIEHPVEKKKKTTAKKSLAPIGATTALEKEVSDPKDWVQPPVVNEIPVLKANVKDVPRTPEGFYAIAARFEKLDEYTKRISAAAIGNPAAVITAADSQYTREYQPLVRQVKDEYIKLYDLAVNGADPQPERMDALVENLERLDTMSTEIAEYLKGKTLRTPLPSAIPTPTAVPTPNIKDENVRINAELAKDVLGVTLKNFGAGLAERSAYRDMWLDKKEIDASKEKGDPARFYASEKGALKQMLEFHYRRNLFATMGSKMRGFLGLRPTELPPDLERGRQNALEARSAYRASIETRFIARLDREVANNRMSPAMRDKQIVDFRVLMANRFAFQNMDMVLKAESGALSNEQDGAFKKALLWYGNLGKPQKIMVGSAVTLAAGLFASTASTVIAGRMALKSILIGTGLGVLAGRKVNDVIVAPEQERYANTVSGLSQSYSAQSGDARDREYVEARRSLARRETMGVAAGALVGAGVAGGVTAFGEQTFDAVSRPKIIDTTSVRVPVVSESPTVKIPVESGVPPFTPYTETSPSPESAPMVRPIIEGAPTMPSIAEVVPDYALHEVVKNDTIWDLLEDDSHLKESFSAGHDRDAVLMEVRQTLIDNPELAREIGISSGNPDLIRYPSGTELGDTLNMTRLSELLNEKVHERLHIEIDDGDEASDDTADIEEAERSASETIEELTSHPEEEMPSSPPKTISESLVPKVTGPENVITIGQDAAPKSSGILDSLSGANPVAAEIAAATVVTAGNLAENIKKRRDAIIRAFGDAPDTFWSRFSSRNDTSYGVLKQMTVGVISREISVLGPREQEVYAKVHGVEDTGKFVHWIQNFEYWKNMMSRNERLNFDNLRFDDFLGLVAKYQEERGEPIPPPAT